MVSTRRSKGSPPTLTAQDSDLYGGVLSQEQDAFPNTLSQDSDTYAESQSLLSQASPRNKKRRRSPRNNGSQSPASGAESPKSDSSAREKMRKTRIQEPETQIPKSSQDITDEMVDVQTGEVSPGGNRRKRPHDEIASTMKDAKTPTSESENRSPSRAANGEPLGKKLRETPTPPRDVDDTCMFAPIPENIQTAFAQCSGFLPLPEPNEQSKKNDHLLSTTPENTDRESSYSDVPIQPLTPDSSSNHSNNDCSNGLTPPKPGEVPRILTASPHVESPQHEDAEVGNGAGLTKDHIAAENDAPKNGDAKPTPRKEELKIAPGSGFSNTSAISPFGALSSTIAQNASTSTAKTSQSGFGTSQLTSFANVTSAFGVSPSPLAASSPFGGPPTGSDNVFSKMSSASTQSMFPGPPLGSSNVFAKMSGNISSSGFGAVASPFGSSGSIFGNPLAMKPLPKAQPLEGIKNTDKSEADDQDSENEDSESEDTAEGNTGGESENSKNTQFGSKVIIKSGEENYDMIFQARAKLFELYSGAWKERGIGNIRVLVPKPEEEFDDTDSPTRPTVGRIVMRQEGVGRLILNTNMFKGMLPDGKAAAENTVRLLAVNTVTLAEAHDENDKGKDAAGSPTKDAEKEGNGSTDKTDEPNPPPAAKPVLKTYLLRFKGVDLAKGFKENVAESLPL